MFVSIRGRVLINVEALNMTESVGNYVKHRRVPVILPKGGYVAFFVPAISGESIAHGFQEVLAQTAISKGLPVCSLCSKGIFLKSTNKEVVMAAFNIRNTSGVPNDENKFEELVVSKCVVEDVGGFLYAPKGGGQVKRTSHFATGYMIPVKEALESTVIEPQLHSRYALGTKFVRRGAVGQMIYYVEMSSSVFTFSFDLDTRYIGKATYSIDNVGKPFVSNIGDRVRVTLEALRKFLLEMMFGAKKTRFLPVVEWESLVIAISDDVWTVASPNSSKYIENTISKANKINPNVKLFVYINPDVLEGTSQYIKRKTENLIETMKQIIEEWKKNIREKMPEYADKIDWDKIVKEKLESLISKRLEEVTEAVDASYLSAIHEAYKRVYEISKGKAFIRIYSDLTECVNDAIEEGLSRI